MCWSTATCTTQEIISTNEGQSHISRIILIWIKGQPQSGIIGKALKKTSTAMGFWFLNFGFEYLKDFKVLSRFIQNASNPPTCWDHGLYHLYGHIPQSFLRTVLQKCGRFNNISWDYGLWVKNSNIPQSKPKIEQYFGGFFQQIKVWQPIGRKDSKQPLIPTSRRIRCIFAWSGSELWLFSNIQDQN
jgi:hypothetical protein